MLEIRPGEAVCIPRGAVHGFDNQKTEDAKFLAISTPGLMTPEYFREIHDVLTAIPAAHRIQRRLRRSCAGTG